MVYYMGISFDEASFNDVIGADILSVEGLEVDSEMIKITTTKGVFAFFHYQDCCESVSIEDIVNPQNLSGTIYDIIEKTKEEENSGDGSVTYTFYTIKTSRGYCDIRWYGTSNGYYSEAVDFGRCKG